MVFSDRLLRTLKFEFQDIEVLRLRDLHDLETLDDRLKLAIKLIVFDEATIGSYLRSSSRLDPLYREVGKVLAYTAPQIARDFHRNLQKTDNDVELGFLPMNAPLDAWLAMLRLLVLGQAFMPADLLEDASPCAMDKVSPKAPSFDRDALKCTTGPVRPVTKLTDRESQVLKLVASGLSNKVVAHQLDLSEHTVKLHLHRIFSKIGVRNRAGATNWFMSHAQTPDMSERGVA